MRPLDKWKFYKFDASGESTAIQNGPFTLGEIIAAYEYISKDPSSVNNLAGLEVGENFVFGMVKVITRLPNEDWVYNLYMERNNKSHYVANRDLEYYEGLYNKENA